ncbi:cyclopropane fatty acyl phospholipid synthase-like protein [Leptotrombidium deliense]|uniref:Cyclopropane fatty acyl phospholipid synthase-like protein n=1 Tax=Leptotrombidium deliense TaxID=299467 RepID=A0A443S671_9ACAR|nr:cyclopropane fatty acyl phospholipid synthase-like protein [Leptotrombidium deliense]
MFEHVGENHHREYFKKVDSLLKDDGLFLMQSGTVCDANLPSYDPMFEKNIKFSCYIPKPEEVCLASKGLFIIEDVQNHTFRTAVTAIAFLRNLNNYRNQIKGKSGEKIYKIFYLTKIVYAMHLMSSYNPVQTILQQLSNE